MKKIIISLLAVLAFSWASGVAADRGMTQQSPESLVTCSSVDIYVVTYTAISNSVNPDACAQESPCNPCIESLESQGCKIVDLQIDLLDRDIGGEGNWPQAFASFALSCKKP
jgi:hypothetical protein